MDRESEITTINLFFEVYTAAAFSSALALLFSRRAATGLFK